MRIAFMGTPDYAEAALAALLEAGAEVVLVVTQPDRPRGRKGEPAPPPVKVCAKEHGIPVLQPAKVRAEESVEAIREYAPDLFIVAAFGQILSKELLDMPPLGCVNIHASLLPRLRGASPIQQAILDGEGKTGITLMRMDEGVDTGDILLQRSIEIDPEDTGGTLFDKLSRLGASTIVEALPALEAGTLTPIPQDESLATHCSRLTKEDGRVVWTRPAVELERRIRALDPWPSSTAKLPDGRGLKLWRARVVEDIDVRTEGMTAGSILETNTDSIIIQTGDGAIAVSEVQLEGKRRMSVHDFLQGYQLQPGMVLG